MTKEQYAEKRKALFVEAETLINDGKFEDYNAKEQEIKDLDKQFEDYGKAQANMNALKEKQIDDVFVNMTKDTPNVVDTQPNQKLPTIEDKFDTADYRKAFMNYTKTGVMPPEFQNSDAYTSTSEAGAVISTTIMQKIIKEMKEYGQIFSRVRKTNIKGGVEVPILSLKPSASWITESTPSGRQKLIINTNVTFSYYGLECKVATSLLAEITTLDIFETTVAEVIAEAMIKALNVAIISGSGNGQPLGITKDERVPGGNIITLTSAEFLDWGAWKKKVFAKIPLAYRAGGSFIMAAGTFEGYIDGMQDANGQPMGRTNYGIVNAPQERFGGKEVLLVEDDVVPAYSSASTADVVAVFCKLSDYAINSNMQMRMFRWLDHDTNQYVDKAILVADGKIIDPNGVLIIKKGA